MYSPKGRQAVRNNRCHTISIFRDAWLHHVTADGVPLAGCVRKGRSMQMSRVDAGPLSHRRKTCHSAASRRTLSVGHYEDAPYRPAACEQHCNCGNSPYGSKRRPIADTITLLAMLSIVCHLCSTLHAAPPMHERSC